MKRTILKCTAILLGFVCMVSGTFPAMAAMKDPIQPMYTGISYFQPNISINSSGKVTCTDTVRIKSGYSAKITWELQALKNNQWTTEKTWSDSGSGTRSLGRSQYVASGYNYRLTTTVKAYNSSNVLVDDEWKASTIVSY